MAKKKSTFGADFKKFISRGNVVDMAVGVVVGGAFGKIVTGFVNYVINPFVAIFLPAGSLDEIKTVTKEAVVEVVDGVETVVTPEVAILWGTWLQTIIDFLIIAFVLFLVMRIASAIAARSAKVRERIKNALTDEDEKAALAAAEAAANESAKATAEEVETKAEPKVEEPKVEAPAAEEPKQD